MPWGLNVCSKDSKLQRGNGMSRSTGHALLRHVRLLGPSMHDFPRYVSNLLRGCCVDCNRQVVLATLLCI